jgi:hypothetical protein
MSEKEENTDIIVSKWGPLPTVLSGQEIMEEAAKMRGVDPKDFARIKSDLAGLKNFIDGQGWVTKQINDRLAYMLQAVNSKMDVKNFDDIKQRLAEVERKLEGLPDKIAIIEDHLGISENADTPSMDARLKVNEEEVEEQRYALNTMRDQLKKKKRFGFLHK